MQRSHRTPLGPVRDHLRALMRSMRLADIAQAAGVPESTLDTILWSSRRYTLSHTAQAILAVPVPPPTLSNGRYLDATGTRRRVQALMRIGWPQPILAARLGVSTQQVSLYLRQPVVTRKTATKVRDLYRELASQLGPSRDGYLSAAVRAAARGFHGPAAWDDATIDDPNAEPIVDGEPAEEAAPYDELTVQLAVAGAFRYGQLDRAELVEAIRRLAAAGKDDTTIAEHLRWPGRNPSRTVCKIRHRAGIPAGQAVNPDAPVLTKLEIRRGMSYAARVSA